MMSLPQYSPKQVVGQLKLFNWLYQYKAHVKHQEVQGSCYRVERQDVPQPLQHRVEELVALGVVVKHYKKFQWRRQKQKVCCLELVLHMEYLPPSTWDNQSFGMLVLNFGPIVEPLRPGPGAGIRFFRDGREKPEGPPAVFSGQGIRANIESQPAHVYDRNVNVGRMLLDMAGIERNREDFGEDILFIPSGGIDGKEPPQYLSSPDVQLYPLDKARIAQMIRDGMPDPPDKIITTSS